MRTGRRVAVVLLLTILVALAGCGSSNKPQICPLNTVGCGCNGTSKGIPCRAPAYVYADGLNQQISIFPVDLSTNGLGTPTSVTGPSTSLGMAAMNNAFLYASAPSSGISGSSGINAWSINPTTGALTPVPGSPFSLGPLSLAAGLAADGAANTLYVADAGRIDVLKADSIGALTPITGSPFTTGTSLFLAIDPQDRFLFAADVTPPGNLLAYTIDAATGALTVVPGSPFPMGTTSTLFLGIAVDPLGKYVYVVAEGSNQLAAFSIASNGVLTPVPGSPFTTGNMPMAVAAGNGFVYVTNAGDGTVSGYKVDSSTGALAPIAGSPFALDLGVLTTDSAGNFLYSAGVGGMMAFKIDATSGALTQIGNAITFPGAAVLTYVQ